MVAEKETQLQVSNTNDLALLEERMDFMNINDDIKDRLRNMKPVLEKHLPDVLDDFYNMIDGWPNLRALFQSEKMKTGARNAQITHWQGIVTGNFDHEYQESVTRIGHTHNRIGLEPRWYIGGYAALIAGMIEVLAKEYLHKGKFGKGNKDQFEKTVSAFIKAALLDMDMAISTYFDAGKDEFENLLKGMTDNFDQNVAVFIKELSTATDDLKSTASTLQGLANSGQSKAYDLGKAAAISAENVSTVASASEEMSASIKEINQQISKAS